MIRRGKARDEMERMLADAFADGLLSEETFTRRIEHVLKRRLIDPVSLIGDLSFRGRSTWQTWIAHAHGAIR